MHSLVRRAAVLAGGALVLPALAAGVAGAGVAGAAAAPVLTWSPATSPGTYDFGALNPGQTVSQRFTLTNSGTKATTALKIALTGSAAFTKSANTCAGKKVAANGSCTVTVRYDPTTPGQSDSATLTATGSVRSSSMTLQGTAAKASPAIATAPSTGGTVGTSVTDAAALAGGDNPTGTIEFTLYGPSKTADCTGAAMFDQAVTVTGDGGYTSPPFTPSQPGTYWWAATYSGDARNNQVASACDSEPVTITQASPVITTKPSVAGTGIVGGSTITDLAALSGASPTGTIEFQLYGPSATAACTGTPVDDETVTVTGGGIYTTPNGAMPSQAGTYWWTASYSGDANNAPAASACGASSVTISKASPGVTVTGAASGPGYLGTTTLTAAVTLPGSYHPGGTVEFRLYGPAAVLTNDVCSGTPVDDETGIAGDSGAATPHGFTPTKPGTYYWTASYSGDGNNNPVTSPCGTASPLVFPAPAGLYWTNSSDGSVWTANLDGSGAQQIDSGQNGPSGIAAISGRIFWADSGDGTIWQGAPGGGGANAAVSGQDDPTGMAFAFSSAGPPLVGYLYWTDSGSGTIWRASVVQPSETITSPQIIVSGLTDPAGLAVSPSVDQGHLYWTDASSGTIWEANADGSGAQAIFSGQAAPAGIAIGSAVITPPIYLYWADSGSGTIAGVNPGSSTVQPVVSGQDTPQGVASNSQQLFWADSGAGKIWIANPDGSGAHPIVSGQPGPTGIAVPVGS